MPNLRALATSSSERRRMFSVSALARKNWSAKSAFLALSSASSVCKRCISSAIWPAMAASSSSGLASAGAVKRGEVV